MKKEIDVNEVSAFLDTCGPDTKVYIGADSERFQINGEWFADYILAVVIHIDGRGGPKIYGINWVHGGNGGMKYWDNPKNYTLKPLVYDVAGRPRIDIETKSLPDKIYPMESNCAYLVNASVPHTGYNNHTTESRYAISIRPKYEERTWKEFVQSMKHLIIND